MGDGVLQMLHAVGDVARLVRQRAAVEEALGVVVGVAFQVLVERHGEDAAQQEQIHHRLRPAAAAFQDQAVHPAGAFQAQAAAVHQRPFAKALEVPRRIEAGSGEKLLHLVVAVGHAVLPAGDGLDVHVGVADQLRADLADGVLHIVRQRFDGVPRHVGGGDPAPRDGFLVEVRGGGRPQAGFVAHGVADWRHAASGHRAARVAALVRPMHGHFAVHADVEIAQFEAGFAGPHAHAPLFGLVHPVVFGFVLGRLRWRVVNRRGCGAIRLPRLALRSGRLSRAAGGCSLGGHAIRPLGRSCDPRRSGRSRSARRSRRKSRASCIRAVAAAGWR